MKGFWWGLICGLAAVAFLFWRFSDLTQRGDLYAPLQTSQVSQQAQTQGFHYLTFDDLRPDPAAGARDPFAGAQPSERAREFAGQGVVLEGYAEPLVFAGRKVREFQLIRHLASCCFGAPMQLHDVVHVAMQEGSALDLRRGDGVAVYGVLRLGSPGREGALYRLEAQRAEITSPF